VWTPPPTIQWRKNGNIIPNATNFTWTAFGDQGSSTLIISNVQPSDAGVYDAEVFGDEEWQVSPRIYVSVQTINGEGVFQNPQLSGTNFTCSLLGAATRNYDIQWSTNLTSWNDLVTVSNATGTINFTNSASGGAQFYRSILLP